ncbi:MAG: hypothetical protein QM714_16440 [Nocardioides sp.]|uniref:hypothetical protein n=1 Tax=Nocardioides sp. TaxID=35761 RepID=UPI0039E34181
MTANAIQRQIWGNEAEKEAAHYLGWRAMTDPIADCMADRGMDYYRRFEPVWGGYQPDGLGDTWTAPHHLKQSDRGLAQAEVLPAAVDEPEAPDWVMTDRYRSAAMDCEGEMGDPSRWDSPPGVAELDDEYDSLLADVEDGLGDVEEYDKCMADEGIRFGEEDADCRADKYAEGLAILAPRLTEFEQEHAADLAATQDEWAKILKQAIALGFDPAHPAVVTR